MIDEPLAVVARVCHVLDDLGVTYAIGGSVASSVHGVPRATLDVDIVAALAPAHVRRFVSALEATFYVDADAVRDAIRRSASFNLLFLESMFKVDVFVAPLDAWSRSELARASPLTLDVAGEPVTLRFATAEDTLLHKLVWYRLGNEQSDRQWGDVAGIVRVAGPTLDRAYLTTWAEVLRVSDLLARALSAT